MKKLKNLSIVFFFILFSGLLITCKKENNKPDTTDQNKEVFFKIDRSRIVSKVKSSSTLKSDVSYSLGNAKKVVITVLNIDGSSTNYTSSAITIQSMGENYFTQKIILKTGSYKLTEFNLIDSTGNTIFAAPLLGSKESQNVKNALPIIFTVDANVATTVNVEVLSTANLTPDDFGFTGITFDEVKLLSFMIGVIDKVSGNLISAKLTVSSGSYIYIQNLDSIANNIVSVKDSMGNYTLTIEKTGFAKYTKTYQIDSLKLHSNTSGNLPLIIELNRTISETVTDIDGNVYQTIKIGNQVWMKENLKTTKFNDGTPIPIELDNYNWTTLSTPAYCWLNNDESTYKDLYGALYNSFAVSTGKLAPIGWHVPTKNDWMTLILYLGGDTIGVHSSVGGKLKEVGNGHWLIPNTGADNSSGFTGLPSGFRWGSRGSFGYWGEQGSWWSSTIAKLGDNSDGVLRFSLLYNYNDIFYDPIEKQFGASVRCLKNN